MPHRTQLYVVVGKTSQGTYKETVTSLSTTSESDSFYITPKRCVAKDSIGELQGVHDYLRMIVLSRQDIRYAKHKIRTSFYQKHVKIISDSQSVLKEISQRVDQDAWNRKSHD